MNKDSVSTGWTLVAAVFAVLFALGQFGQVLVRYPNYFVIGLILVSFGMVMFFGDWKTVNADDMEDK